MKLTKQEVLHIATLARLELTEKEKEKFSGQLSAILGYFKELQKVNLKKIEPTAQVTGLENVTRPDVVKKCDAETMKKLVAAAPEKVDNLVKVKAVFE